MKKQILFAVSLALICSSLLAMTKEQLIEMFLAIDSGDSIESAKVVGLANLNLLEDILLINHGDNTARLNSLTILKIATKNGQYSEKRFFQFLLDQLRNISTYARPEFVNDETEDLSRLLYDWREANGDIAVLLKMFARINELLLSMVIDGSISGPSLANSLVVKIDSAKHAIEKHQAKGLNQATNIIEAAKKEASAQEGHFFGKAACKIFINFCDNLIWQINHTTF